MKTKSILFLLFVCSFITAGSKGPSLTGVTHYILKFVQEDGRWYPQRDWTVKGLNAGEEVRTNLLDEKGKTVAYATWKYNHNYDGDWSKMTGVDKFGPTGNPDSDYPNLPRLKEGNYKLEILAANKLIWQTDFEIFHYKCMDRDYYRCTGPWKTVAYFYCCGEYSGGLINFWFEGSRDLSWFNQIGTDYERILELKTEVKNETGEVILTNGPEQYDDFKVYPGESLKFVKTVCSLRSDFEQKVLGKDGKYKVIVYAGDALKNAWYPIVDFPFMVKDGKIPINEALSGESSEPIHRFITSSACYQKDVVKNTIPKFTTF